MQRTRKINRNFRLASERLEARHLLATIGGTVFDDLDRDGVYDAQEEGLSQWTVHLQPIGTATIADLTLQNPTPDEWSQFGRFVSGVGDNILVSSHHDEVAGPADSGAAYLYDGQTGELLHTFLSPTPAAGNSFARSVAGIGNNVLIGAHFKDTTAPDTGAAYLFDGSSGELLKTFVSPDPHERDQFGRAVAAVGKNVLVGARFDDRAGENAGAAYLFDGEGGHR